MQKGRNEVSRKGKQIAAWAAIVLLVMLYVVTLIVAILDTSSAGNWVMGCLLATAIIPLLTWMYIWMYGKLTGKATMADVHLLEGMKEDTEEAKDAYGKISGQSEAEKSTDKK